MYNYIFKKRIILTDVIPLGIFLFTILLFINIRQLIKIF